MRYCISLFNVKIYLKLYTYFILTYFHLIVGVVAVNGLIYVFGGEKCNTFEIYDPISDKWTLSENKLGSNHHIITRAFLLNPELNITPDQFSKYYPEYIPDLS